MRTIINTAEGLEWLRAELSKHKVFAFDTETDSDRGNGFDADRWAVSYQIATENGAWYIPLRHNPMRMLISPYKDVANAPVDLAWSIIFDLLRDPTNKVYIHNAAFDLTVIRNEGMHPQRIKADIVDTIIISWLLDSGKPPKMHGMESLVLRTFGHQMSSLKSILAREKVKSVSRLHAYALVKYAVEDVFWLMRLAPLLESRLAEKGESLAKVFRELEMPAVFVLEHMQRRGVLLDVDLLRAMGEKFTRRQRVIEEEISKEIGMRPKLTSTQWLSKRFIDDMKIWGVPAGTPRNKQGCYPTGAEKIKEWAAGAHGTTPQGKAIAQRIAEHKELAKLVSTYTSTLADKTLGSRIHGSFNQIGTRTGRLSSSGPNLQNIPTRTEAGRRIRRAFICQEGWQLVVADYSQIELRLLAHYSQDPVMLKTYWDGGDIHQATADKCSEIAGYQIKRHVGKTINFGVLYGMGPKKLAATLGITEAEARKFMDAYKKGFARVQLLQQNVVKFTRKHRYTQTITGRRRPIRGIFSDTFKERGKAEREAFNTVIQGSAADIVKIAMRNIFDRLVDEDILEKDAYMLIQVHDEIMVEAKQDKVPYIVDLMRYEMENAIKLRVPLVVEPQTGAHWAECK